MALMRPLQFRIAASVEVPRVWRRVFATSRGFVAAAATAPANPPEIQWMKGSCLRCGLRTLERESYAANWMPLH
jgi:hypothetical protein